MISLLALVLSLSAQAELNSPLSGEELFICNAGLAQPTSETVFGLNTLAFSQENLDAPLNSQERFFENQLTSQPGQPLVQIAPTVEGQFQTRIIDTHFKFSSEKFGAQYFIDICYRGPERSQQPGGVDTSEGLYGFELELSLAELGAPSYLASSRLRGQIRTECDLRNMGSQRQARIKTELAPTSFEIDSLNLSEVQSLSTGKLRITSSLNSSNQTAPRFCRTRIVLTESAVQTDRIQNVGLQESEIYIDIQKL
ncbi:MAG: hypothetical protein ACK5RO_10910 [Pseudobdellovibrionaceae bacterium]|jgi:hypothetical protein